MATIQIESEISTEQLLRAVERLPREELETFVCQVLALRAARVAPHFSKAESELMQDINQGVPAETQRRFDDLVAKRQSESITSEELSELIHMTDQMEQLDVQRLSALTALADLRHTSLSALMAELGISKRAYAG